MAIKALADCLKVGQSAEVGQVVGDGTYMSTGEIAKMLKCSQSHVIRLIDSGALPSTKVGTHRRVLRTVAEAYRDKMAAEAGGEA